MLRDDFFELNDIIYDGKRITSLEKFQNQCCEYTLDEHQYPAVRNILYLSKVDVADANDAKVNIILTGSGNELRIGKQNLVNNGLYITYTGLYDGPPKNTLVEIGDKNLFNGRVYITPPVHGGRRIHIGSHNLFANRVLFMGRNDHGIFDKDTHEQLNADHDVVLGDRNWICKDAELYPRARVGNDCVIAAHAVVNHSFQEDNLLLAGIPAVIKRKNIIWNVSCEKEKLEGNLANPLHHARPD